jgi:sigma-B regulation protein RsbU (phosphoserine phosphatase)
MNNAEILWTPLNRFAITVLLIDDQMIVAEAIRRMLFEEKDIQLHYCSNPYEAIELALKVKPTVILQDLVMPHMDGIALLKQFRLNAELREVPLIVLSSTEDPKVKAEAFACGANDYMVKLPDKIEMIARIRYHSAAFIRLLERNDAFLRLAESQRTLHGELAEAAEYVRALLPKPIEGAVTSHWEFIPSTMLGGDAFGYQWLDKDHFAFYLLDVCGHGVGAALLSISVMNVLRSKTLPAANFTQPASVLAALNASFPMEKHNDMFFTMWYGVYQPSTQQLCYADAGHPPAILISGTPEKDLRTDQLKTGGMVVGGMPDSPYTENTVHVGTPNRLYLFSDGLYEITKLNGKIMDIQELIDMLSHTKPGQLNEIIDFSKTLSNGKSFVDDVSILELSFKS